MKRRKYNQSRKIIFSLPAIKLSRLDIVGWLLVLVVWLLVVFFLKSPWFAISHITCIEAQSSCPEEIIAELGKYQGRPTLLTDPDEIKSGLNYILNGKSVEKVQVTLPSTLSVEINPHVPLANITNAQKKQWLLLKSDYFLHELNEAVPGIPVIIVAPQVPVTVGDDVKDNPVGKTYNALREMAGKSIIPEAVYIVSADDIRFKLDQDKIALLSANKDISRQVTTLQLILLKATMDTSRPVIDVRFDRPVLKPGL